MHAAIDIIELQRKVAVGRDQKSYQALFMHFYKLLIRCAVTIVYSRQAAWTAHVKLPDFNGRLREVSRSDETLPDKILELLSQPLRHNGAAKHLHSLTNKTKL